MSSLARQEGPKVLLLCYQVKLIDLIGAQSQILKELLSYQSVCPSQDAIDDLPLNFIEVVHTVVLGQC